MLDFLEIIKEKGGGDLLFDADIETWNEVLNEKPKITRDDESTDYFWSKSGISYFDYNDGTKEMTVIVKKQKKLSYKGVGISEDNNIDVHRAMCELDGETMHKLGYTYLFNLGICLIDFYEFSGGQDDRVVSIFTPGTYSKTGKRMRKLEESEW